MSYIKDNNYTSWYLLAHPTNKSISELESEYITLFSESLEKLEKGESAKEVISKLTIIFWQLMELKKVQNKKSSKAFMSFMENSLKRINRIIDES